MNKTRLILFDSFTACFLQKDGCVGWARTGRKCRGGNRYKPEQTGVT